MTAEIAVMNKSAVALAADSAATLETQRVHKIYMVNKLFALSKRHPIGIMIYGKPELLGVPWETIIGIYREQLGDKKFPTLNEYSDHLISFVEKADNLFAESVQKDYFRTTLGSYFIQINEGILKRVESHAEKKKVTRLKARQIVDDVIGEHCRKLEEENKLPDVSHAWIRKLLVKYASTINDVVKDVFVKLPIKLPISSASRNNLKKIATYLFSRSIFREDISGVVIAGFGNDDIFPHVKSFEVEAVINSKAKYIPRMDEATGPGKDALIIPFAQRDMVAAFMEGVHPDYRKYLFEGLSSLLMKKYPDRIRAEIKHLSPEKQKSVASKLAEINKGVLDVFQQDMQMHSSKKHINPVIKAVAQLPKGELAGMAETLVNLISFRKRMSVDAAETVGGPIDVAVISKADGFVWIKRKFYFEHELNPYFRSIHS